MRNRWLMGDSLLAELHRLRCAPTVAEFDDGMLSFDRVLDDHGIRAVKSRKLQTNLRSLAFPVLTPMVISPRDFRLAMRVLRALQFDQSKDLFITSEDALGFGYGVLVSSDGDVEFHGRRSRQTTFESEYSFNPGMKPDRTPAILPVAVRAHANSSSLEIRVPGLALSGRLKSSFESTVAYRGKNGNLTIDTLHSLNISIVAVDDAVVIRPNTPEAMIRLASIASSGAIMRLDGERKVVVRVKLQDGGEGILDAYTHSSSGPLGQWLRIPNLPFAMQSKDEKSEEAA